MNLAGLDLNLLVVLDALLEEQNVTRAGERVGLSQPAASNALQRLRHLLHDPILERDGRHMRLTERAHLMRAPLRQILEDLKHVLAEPVAFDPATARFQVKIFASDYVTFLLLPRLREVLMTRAPGAQLEISWSDRSRVVNLLEHGAVDLAIGRYDNTPSHIHRSLAFEDENVILCHRDHPALQGELTFERLMSYPRVAVSFEGRNYGYLERAIARAGGDVHCDIVLAHLMAPPLLAAETDLLTITTRRVAVRLQRLLPVGWRPAPFEVPRLPIEVMWHEHAQQDPAILWMRDQVLEVAADL